MLQTQVNYWNLQEQIKHNRATEAQAASELEELTRHNKVYESAQLKQAAAALKQAQIAKINADVNKYVAKYQKDIAYKRLDLDNRQYELNKIDTASRAKQANAAAAQASAALKQAEASWKQAVAQEKRFSDQTAIEKYRAGLEQAKTNSTIARNKQMNLLDQAKITQSMASADNYYANTARTNALTMAEYYKLEQDTNLSEAKIRESVTHSNKESLELGIELFNLFREIRGLK